MFPKLSLRNCGDSADCDTLELRKSFHWLSIEGQ